MKNVSVSKSVASFLIAGVTLVSSLCVYGVCKNSSKDDFGRIRYGIEFEDELMRNFIVENDLVPVSFEDIMDDKKMYNEFLEAKKCDVIYNEDGSISFETYWEKLDENIAREHTGIVRNMSVNAKRVYEIVKDGDSISMASPDVIDINKTYYYCNDDLKEDISSDEYFLYDGKRVLKK